MDYFPPIDEQLVSGLGKQFPDQAPDLDMTEKEIWFKAGQVSVIRWLARRYEDQQEQNLVGRI